MPCLKCGLAHKANLTCNQARHQAQHTVEPVKESLPEKKNDEIVQPVISSVTEIIPSVTKRGRKPIGKVAMTGAERQRRYMQKMHGAMIGT